MKERSSSEGWGFETIPPLQHRVVDLTADLYEVARDPDEVALDLDDVEVDQLQRLEQRRLGMRHHRCTVAEMAALK